MSTLALDDIYNLATGLGTESDPHAAPYRGFNHVRRSRLELEEMYESNWLAGAVVEIPAFEMTRTKRTYTTTDEGELRDLRNHARDTRYWQSVRECIQWSELHGGGGLLLGVEGQDDLEAPLDPESIRQGDLKFIHALDAHILVPDASQQAGFILDPASPQVLMPDRYILGGSNNSPRVHHSRIVRFPGIPLPWMQMARTQWWGASRLARLWDAIATAQEVLKEVAGLVSEAKVDVYKIDNLFDMLQDAEGTKQILNRIAEGNKIKSNRNAIVIDKLLEEYEQKESMLVQGMSATVETYLGIVAAASDIPVTRLLGTSAKGLSATGEGDLRNYYDMVDGRRETYLRPRLDQLDEIFIRSALGKSPEEIEWEFPKLWQIDEKQQAEIDDMEAQTAQKYIDMGVITEVHVAQVLHKRGKWSLTAEDVEEVRRLVNADGDDGEGDGDDGGGPRPSPGTAPGAGGDPADDPDPDPELDE